MKTLFSLLLLAGAAAAQQLPALSPVQRFAIARDPITIARPAEVLQPFTLVGQYGALLGAQDGSFEAWQFPVKILSHFGITAELANYPMPIELSEHTAGIEVSPAMTTITYSHAAFTVKQHMFAPRDGSVGAAVFFEIASARPLTLTFRFDPDLVRMWPALNAGPADVDWVPQGDSGYYALGSGDLSAYVAMPRTRPGILAQFQERPKRFPVELKLSFNPRTDSDLFFPLLIVLGGGNQNPGLRLAELERRIPAMYAETENYWAHFFDNRLTADTPDDEFNDAMRWAAVAIEQCRVKFHNETGLVAGFYPSADSARPGFGWFFGRDTLWTSYAINGYGDFALTRDAIEFLLRRQRADGKIMHEFSQTADLVNWKSTEYFYAAADSTPLLVMAMEDYVNTSGDVAFLKKHWEEVKRAYAFTRAHDSDHDGIYENTEGTGWVESWPPEMPHQEIYLAALDQQSTSSISRLAALMNDTALAASAREKADRIRSTLELEYYDPVERFYAFSRNASGSLDHTATIYPSVAWWSGRMGLKQPGPMLERWASTEFSTDWGTRDLSDRSPLYDPISYHQGSVWPLFTGWASLAEYRAGRPLSGFAHLMQNADLTWTQDPGAVTELLSGAFFQPLGRSTSHQMWSSAMVLTPALRGLFGLDWDALHRTLRLAPHLPAQWDSARLHNVPFGDARLDVEYAREKGQLVVRVRSTRQDVPCLVEQTAPFDTNCTAAGASARELRLPLPPVELGLQHGLPFPGSEPRQVKVLEEQRAPKQFIISLEAPENSVQELPVRLNQAGVRVAGAELVKGNTVRVRFSPYSRRHTVTFSW